MNRERPGGQALSISVPEEAGDPKGYPAVMGVLVMAWDSHIHEWELGLGDAVQVRVGAEYKCYLTRIGPDLDRHIHVVAASGNKDSIVMEYDHPLDGHVVKRIFPGDAVEINPVLDRHITLSCKKW